MAGAPGSSEASLVWPWWQRGLHWALAAAVLIALLTYKGGRVHEALGYAALALALARAVLGFAGPRGLRFASFVHGPRRTLAYTRQVLHGDEPRHLNHNPLGAWMVVVLLVACVVGAGSGALYVTDGFWGDAGVIALHAAACWALLPLVLLHLAGVIHAGWRHRENLVAAMWHGHKRHNQRDYQRGNQRDNPAAPPSP
jgi:cytochrome b